MGGRPMSSSPARKPKTRDWRIVGLVGGALILPAAAALVVTTRSSSRRTVDRSAPAPEVAPPQASSGAGQLRRIRAPFSKATPSSRRTPFAPSGAPKEPLPDYQTLEATWSREKEDQDWTTNAATNIQAIFAANDAGPMPRFSTRCGTTVCRVDFDGKNQSSLMALAGSTDRSAFRYQMVPSDGGSVVRVFFVHEAAAPAQQVPTE